jgi:hypothetical protein
MKYAVVLLILIFSLLLSGVAWSYEFLEPFGYVWVNGSHNKTNLERDDFDSDIIRAEAKIGVSVLPLWANATLQPYFAYYGVTSTDKSSWNNNNVYGFGVQVMPLLGYNDLGWVQDLKIFFESLAVEWTNEDDSNPIDNPEYNNKEDLRYGIDIWHEWNQPGADKVENRSLLFGELWASLTYRTTNFGYDDFNDWLFYFQPTVGMYSIKPFNSVSLEPYFKAYMVNNIAYGGGIRIRPFGSNKLLGSDFSVLRKLKFFIEVLAVSYLKEAGPVDHELRVGFDLNIGR